MVYGKRITKTANLKHSGNTATTNLLEKKSSSILMEKKSARKKTNAQAKIGAVAISVQNMDSFPLPMILASAPTAEKVRAAACMDSARTVPANWEDVRCVVGNGDAVLKNTCAES